MSLLERLESRKKNESALTGKLGERVKPASSFRTDPFQSLKSKIHKRIVGELGMADLERRQLEEAVTQIADACMDEEPIPVPRTERGRIISEIIDEVTGYGPIQSLLKDESVSEVMVNGPNQVYAERKGKLVLTDIRFRDDAHVMHVIEKIVSPLGRRIDESSPMVDARLPDGSRVNAVIPPLALKGPSITIRKFAKDPFTVDDLIRFGTLTKDMAELLQACVEGKLNIVVSGGTGSGKTTTLNVLSSFIPAEDRIITIEDAAELQLRQEHVVTLETRPPNIEGKGAVSMRDLVRNSLRMRPDRIVLGECRGDEVRDVLAALGTGHAGGCATLHASSAAEVPVRIEALALAAGLPPAAIGAQLCTAFDVVLHLQRSGAQRRLAEVGVVERAADGSAQVLVALSDDAPPGRGPGWESLVERWPGPWVEPLVSANRARLAVVGGAS